MAVLGLRSQEYQRCGAKVLVSFVCTYRHNDRRCAIGWLLEGLEIPIGLNAARISHLFTVPQIMARLQGLSLEFLNSLQSTHDKFGEMTALNSEETAERIKANLLGFARIWGLNAEVLHEEV